MILRRLIHLILIASFLITGGCYTTYTGFYHLDHSLYLSKTKTHEIETLLFDTLKPLGFEPQRLPMDIPDYFTLFHRPDLMQPEYADLEGSTVHIIVSFDPDDFTITIRDFDNDKETEFMKVLKKTIEQNLHIQYGIKEIIFERHVDILW